MRRPSRTGLSWMFAFCANFPLMAQDLESIGREKFLSFSGGISVNQIFYSSRGIPSRRDRYSYFSTGNLNMSIYGWTIPLTFSVSNHNTTFTQPFNRYTTHPTWKWITVHAGYTSMSFSPYTVNGHMFSGIGIDLAPEGKWKVSALYGRFVKAVAADTSHAALRHPSYQRLGYGMKLTYGNGRNFLDFILFHAEDDKRSIVAPPDSLQITPRENLVISVAGGKSIFKHFSLKGEVAASAITRDTRMEKTTDSNLLGKSPLFFQPRLSSAYYQAIKTTLDYQHGDWLVGLGYERIDPEYQTLGAYYFNNDLENITVNSSASLLKNKLNVAVSAGLQHDNIQKTKISTMRRLVNAVNITCSPSHKLNFSALWSTFQTYTNIRSAFEHVNEPAPYHNVDTLNFAQISNNASLAAMFILPGSVNKKENINVNITLQDASDSHGLNLISLTRLYNLSAAYSLSRLPSNFVFTVTFNAAVHESPFVNTRLIGPAASVTRLLLRRKLRTTAAAAYSNTYNNGSRVNRFINVRFNSAFSVHDKHSIYVSAVLVNRFTAERAARSVTELTDTAGYHYSFRRRG